MDLCCDNVYSYLKLRVPSSVAWSALMQYDNVGRPAHQRVRHNGRTLLDKSYLWGDNLRLLQALDTINRRSVRYDYNTFGSLSGAIYDDGSCQWRNPDAMGNVYDSPDRTDRSYGRGGQLREDKKWRYYYDSQGNLVLKTMRRSGPSLETGMRDEFLAWQSGDYAYTWQGNGMLRSVTRPDGKTVTFRYDALGRRIEKVFDGRVYRYLWDGDVILHEWDYAEADRPNTVVTETGEVTLDRSEPVENLITWVYDSDCYVPTAKLVDDKHYSIVSDYIGRPVQAYDDNGNIVWQADYDIYGNVRNLHGSRQFIPFRQLGQYEDEETGLYYNRFRYYDPKIGNYISQDPIRLAGNNPTLYGYVRDCNTLIDIWGLSECNVKGVEYSLSHKTFDVPNPYDDCFKGVKLASQYLREMGVSRAKRKEILESFEIGTIKVQKAGVNEYGIRFFGGNAQPMGQFLSDTFGPMTNRANLALPPKWNSMTGIKQWKIKPETTMIKGKVAPQLNEGPQYIGGANQIFILEPWKYGSLS